MRISLRHSLLAAGWLAVLGASAARAQEPEPAPVPAPAQPPTTQPPTTEPPAAEEPAAPPAPARHAVVIEAGTVHPVSGPAIPDGVVVIDGERITAIGKKGEVDIPADAVVRSFPTGHVYPGLVDAATDAYTDTTLRNEGGVDAGTSLGTSLQLRLDREDDLLAAGITTAYVTVRSPGLVRAQGAIVRPKQGAFELWDGHGAVHLRLTNGPGPTHALQRQQQMQAADALFEGLDAFRKARTDHEEALTKYKKEFDEYLAWHQKKKDAAKEGEAKDGAKDGAKPATPPAQPPATPPEGRRRGSRATGGGGSGNGGGGGAAETQSADHTHTAADDDAFADALTTVLLALAQDPPKQDPPKQEQKPAQGPPADGGAAAGDKPAEEKKDEAPKRPTWPKAPAPDPQREALLAVLDGELPLRVEVHRPDEVHAALQLQRKRQIPVLVLEQAYGAAESAGQLAERGVAAVLTDLLPNDLPTVYADFDQATLPARLQAKGVPFAIASGSGRRAALLTLMAAAAVGNGLDRQAALRAITLTPAEILGLAKDIGSLQAGKFADVMVCDRPLFATDSRVLFVLQKGRTEYEAK